MYTGSLQKFSEVFNCIYNGLAVHAERRIGFHSHRFGLSWFETSFVPLKYPSQRQGCQCEILSLYQWLSRRSKCHSRQGFTLSEVYCLSALSASAPVNQQSGCQTYLITSPRARKKVVCVHARVCSYLFCNLVKMMSPLATPPPPLCFL